MKYLIIFLFGSVNFLLAQTDKTYYIEDFGLNGNDAKDDTQNFDKAIEFISFYGGTLKINKGKYYLDNNMRLRTGVNNNNYIFHVKQGFKIKLEKDAELFFINHFKGFRFRPFIDVDENTGSKLDIEISGGVICGAENFVQRISNNPENWVWVGEFLKNFKVENVKIVNFYGTAGIASYNNNYTSIKNSVFINVTGNPNDFIDNHGDAIYISNTRTYVVENNRIFNDINKHRLGRIGICLEYEKTGSGIIRKNRVEGYDRGVHVELIKGNAIISENILTDNFSGIVLWNNYGYKQLIKENLIIYNMLSKYLKPILYITSPILLLGYNTNNNTMIINNNIRISKDCYVPDNLLQITSSGISVENNTFQDNSKTTVLSVAQGKSNKEKVYKVAFVNNVIKAKSIIAFDGSNVTIKNNKLDVDDLIFSFDDSDNILQQDMPNLLKEKIKIFGSYKINK